MKKKFEVAINKIRSLLKQGLTPIKLSESIIWCVLISIIPILGVVTFLITTVSLKRKLNLPLMITLSYFLWPLQFLLIIPFIHIGEFIFSIPRKEHSLEEIIASFQNDFLQTLSQLSFELLCGFGGWLVTAVPISYGIYLISLIFLKKDSSQ